MKFVCITIFALILVSCSNQLHVPKNQKGESMNFPAMNAIMKAVKQQVPGVKHIVVAFQYVHTTMWSITLYRFKAIVYDADSKKRLYLANDSDNKFETYFSDKISGFETMDLIMNYYTTGRLNELLKNQERFKDGGDNTAIFDIDFITKTTLEYDLDNLSFDDQGNLTTFRKKYMQQYKKQ